MRQVQGYTHAYPLLTTDLIFVPISVLSPVKPILIPTQLGVKWHRPHEICPLTSQLINKKIISFSVLEPISSYFDNNTHANQIKT